MQPLYVEQFMSNYRIRKVSIGWCKELNAAGIDDYSEIALTLRSTFVQFGIEYYIDVQACSFLHFTDEFLNRLAQAGEILGLHRPMMPDIALADFPSIEPLPKVCIWREAALANPTSASIAQCDRALVGTARKAAWAHLKKCQHASA